MLAVFCSLLTARRFLRKDVCRERSGRWYRPAVDNVFGSCDGRRTWRRQKRDQIGYLFRLGRPAERNAAKRIHDDLSTTLVVGGVLPRELGDETYSAVSLDPAGRDTDDAHPLGTHFLGQRLAVVRQGRFRRRVGYRRLWQRRPILYRGDVDDYAGALFDHGRYERTIQTHGGERVLIERRVPLLIVEYRKTSGRSRRAADDVHNDVHAAGMLADGISDGGAVVIDGGKMQSGGGGASTQSMLDWTDEQWEAIRPKKK